MWIHAIKRSPHSVPNTTSSQPKSPVSKTAAAESIILGLRTDRGVPFAAAHEPPLADSFDWALDEQCFQYVECYLLTPFIQAHKAVFEVEYGDQSLTAVITSDAVSELKLRRGDDAHRFMAIDCLDLGFVLVATQISTPEHEFLDSASGLLRTTKCK